WRDGFTGLHRHQRGGKPPACPEGHHGHPRQPVTDQQPELPPMSNKDIVLAFSGGLDTSFCVPYLQERGWNVHTVFADTGGVDAEERDFIEKRAAELGVASHVTV